MSGKDETKSKSPVPFWCSVRVIIVFVGFLGVIVHFSQKTNVSIALVCMVNHSAIELHEKNSINRHFTDLNQNCLRTNKTNRIEGSYIWSKNIQGIILASYFGGYIMTQIPTGYLAGRYGARFFFSGAIFISSLVTLCMPVAAATHWRAFIILQILAGFAHGAIWSCMSVIMAHWGPANERGKLMSFMNGGAQVGNVLILSTGGMMCSWRFAGGWPLIFYSVGAIGLVWSIVWVIIYTDSPRDHRFISVAEKYFILENTQQQLNDNSKIRFHTPWQAILSSSACWGLFIMHTCCNWGSYTFLTSTPKYLDEVLGFDIKSNGILSALPYASQWFSVILSGIIADMLVQKKLLSITQTRKLFTVLGSFIPALLILSLAFMTCQSKYIAVSLLTIGIAFSGCCLGGGFSLIPNDIAPDYAGIISGISNTFATIPGIISPYIVGALTEKDPKNWRIVFYICAGIYTIGAIMFLWIGSGELQPWAKKHTESSAVCEDLLLEKDDETTGKITVIES